MKIVLIYIWGTMAQNEDCVNLYLGVQWLKMKIVFILDRRFGVPWFKMQNGLELS